jgi:hypothetical protein
LDHRALNVDVGIHQTRADEPARQVHDLAGAIVAKTKYAPIVDANVCRMDLAGKDIDQLGILEHQVSRFFTPGDSDQLV